MCPLSIICRYRRNDGMCNCKDRTWELCPHVLAIKLLGNVLTKVKAVELDGN